MARGVAAGILTGLAVSAVGFGALSISTPLPQTSTRSEPPPDATALEVPPGSEFNRERADTIAVLPDSVGAKPDAAAAPRVAAPEPESDGPTVDTLSAGVPEATTSEDALAEPGDPTSAPDVAAGPEEPVLPNPQAMPPAVPEDAPENRISTDPAQPVPPQIEEDIAPFATTRREGTVPDLGAESAAPNPAQGATAPSAAVPDDGPDAETTSPESLPEPPQDGAPFSNMAGSLTDRDDPARADLPVVTAPGEDAGSQNETSETVSPLSANAVPFENPQGKPLLSVVLIDEAGGSLGPEALTGFPYPITIAIDAAQRDARALSQSYHAAGFEIAALAQLPRGALPSDAEVVMAANIDSVTRPVAILEAPDGSLQADQALAGQVVDIVARSGHGLLFQTSGLNGALKRAVRAGVPARAVYRYLDGDGQDAVTIRRTLDQAAFRAVQEGPTIVLGRLRAETISALLLWSLQDRAARVALAPVSAALLSQD